VGARRGQVIRDALDGRSGAIPARTHGRRQRCLAIAFTVVAVFYSGRLVKLQLVEGDGWSARRLAQSVDQETIPASRGEILDRDGQPLAADDTRYQAFLAAEELELDRGAVMRAIDAVLNLSPERRMALETADSDWTSIAKGVTDEERTRLASSIGPGVHFEPHPARSYPQGAIARRLVGRIGPDGEGTSGLELYLDSLLRGEAGTVAIRVDGRRGGYRPPDATISEPRPGLDVVLTIDPELQRIAENGLRSALARTGSSAGDIILMNPRTGELLAVASEREGAAQGYVPAFSDPYEPGSTAKPFLLAALLSEGLVDLDEVIDVEGGQLRAGRRTIRDVHGYDRLTVREVIAQSSNVGAAKLSERVRPLVQQSYLRDFGFGMPTLVDYPGEAAGRLRRAADWTALSPASHAMGYELSVTSLQLAAAYGVIANDGKLMRPMLIREIRDQNGEVVRRFEPRVVRQVIRPEIAEVVGGVLADVVADGTGSLAAMASLRVAGKTGTAKLAADGRYVQGRYRASFVGYAPADDPRVVILTRLEDPVRGSFYGGAIAAPTSQATLAAALATRGGRLDRRLVVSDAPPRRWSTVRRAAEPDGPFIFAVGGVEQVWDAPDETTQRMIGVPDLTGLPLRAAVARLHELGLRVEWHGRGAVAAQNPAPGGAVAHGSTVVLR